MRSLWLAALILRVGHTSRLRQNDAEGVILDICPARRCCGVCACPSQNTVTMFRPPSSPPSTPCARTAVIHDEGGARFAAQQLDLIGQAKTATLFSGTTRGIDGSRNTALELARFRQELVTGSYNAFGQIDRAISAARCSFAGFVKEMQKVDQVDVARRHRSCGKSCHNTARLVVGRRRCLGDLDRASAAVDKDEIGERPPTSTPATTEPFFPRNAPWAENFSGIDQFRNARPKDEAQFGTVLRAVILTRY